MGAVEPFPLPEGPRVEEQPPALGASNQQTGFCLFSLLHWGARGASGSGPVLGALILDPE